MFPRKLIRRITPWLTLYLLVASIGLPLQRVYCACVGEMAITLLGAAHECSAHETAQVLDASPVHACCKKAKACSVETSVDRDCGSSELLVAALDADFLVEKAGYRLPVTGYGLLVNVAWVGFADPFTRIIPKTRPVRGPDPPPLLAGRALLVAQQTFLI